MQAPIKRVAFAVSFRADSSTAVSVVGDVLAKGLEPPGADLASTHPCMEWQSETNRPDLSLRSLWLRDPRWYQPLCSMDEDGLYDYVIVNDELDKASEELTLIAERALAGEVGAAPEHMQVLPGLQSGRLGRLSQWTMLTPHMVGHGTGRAAPPQPSHAATYQQSPQ